MNQQNAEFDRLIRQAAAKEKTPVPEGYENRVNRVLQGLPEYPKKRRERSKQRWRVLVIAAAMMAASFTVVVASPVGQQMVQGIISYFRSDIPTQWGTPREAYEKYNSAVGATVTDQGISLTLDNITFDDNYITVFYTAKSDTGFTYPDHLKDDRSPWREKWMGAYFDFKTNGQEIQSVAQVNTDNYFVDDYTMKGMQQFALVEDYPDTINLEISTRDIAYQEGNWSFQLSVDKSVPSQETISAEPNQTLKAEGNRVTIKRFSITPTGALLVVDGEMYDFAVQDDQGRYLTVVPEAVGAGGPNAYKILGADLNTKSVTIIPLKFSTDPLDMVSVSIADFASDPDNHPEGVSGYEQVEAIEQAEDHITVTFRPQGLRMIADPQFDLLDQDGNSVYLGEESYMDFQYQSDGTVQTTVFYPYATQEQKQQIAALGLWRESGPVEQAGEPLTLQLQ